MHDLVLDHVRCFASVEGAPIAPITFLVGENSTGKSTFLSMYRIATDIARSWNLPDFNEDPFALGGWREIAHYRGSRWRAEKFACGLRIRGEKGKANDTIDVRAEFRESGTQPSLSSWRVFSGPFGVTVSPGGPDGTTSVAYDTPSGRVELDIGKAGAIPFSILSNPEFIDAMRRIEESGAGTKQSIAGSLRIDKSDFEHLQGLFQRIENEVRSRPIAFAPVRTKPSRTYDPITDVPEPEGGHVPLVLAKLKAGDRSRWDKLRSTLDSFGAASGLFRHVDIRTLGRSEGGPFQVLVRFAGPAFNLVDVGYGVSQILPIVVDALRSPSGSTLLIQQPEVHLHPRAQAAFASLVAHLVVHERKRFLIETHSDFLIDRIRIEVRERDELKAGDVSILFFSRSPKGDVEVYPIRVDTTGNILDAPKGYRAFFLQEEGRILGI